MKILEYISDKKNYTINGDLIYLTKHRIKIPIVYIDGDITYIIFDIRLRSSILSIIKFLTANNVDFYLTSHLISNPKNRELSDKVVLENYLASYIEFYFDFKKIEFDVIENMVKWAKENNCSSLIKESISNLSYVVGRSNTNYYTGRSEYEHHSEIIDSFKGLNREIEINNILL